MTVYSLQSIGRLQLLNLLLADFGSRTSEAGLGGCTISYHHHVLKVGAYRLHADVHLCLGLHLHGLHTHARDNQGASLGRKVLQGELTVHVGQGSLSSTFHLHGGTHQRFARLAIDDSTCHQLLGECQACAHHDASKEHKNFLTHVDF